MSKALDDPFSRAGAYAKNPLTSRADPQVSDSILKQTYAVRSGQRSGQIASVKGHGAVELASKPAGMCGDNVAIIIVSKIFDSIRKRRNPLELFARLGAPKHAYNGAYPEISAMIAMQPQRSTLWQASYTEGASAFPACAVESRDAPAYRCPDRAGAALLRGPDT